VNVRTVLSYAHLAFPLVVIGLSFLAPTLKGARFALYPAWHYGAALVLAVSYRVPGLGGGLVRPGDPIHLFEIVPFLAETAVLAAAYAAVRFYSRHPQPDATPRRGDDVLVFLGLASLSLWPLLLFGLRFSDTFSNAYTMVVAVLPLAFVGVAWRHAGHLAPRSARAGGAGSVGFARLFMSLGVGIVFVAAAIKLGLSAGWKTSFLLVLGSGYTVVWGSMLATVLIAVGLGLYERARYVSAKNISRGNA
jgi:hypothetical protein